METRLLLALLAVLLATSIWCSSAESQAEKSVFVSGKSECLDCAEKNVKTEVAYQGLQVAVKCKSSSGDYKIRGTGKLDKNGDYKVQLPTELIGDNGELKQECFAQLHSVTNAPCPDKNGLNPSKLALKFKKDSVHNFSPASRLPFSSATCTSAFFWPHFKFPPLPKWHLFSKPLPKFTLPNYKFPPKPYCPPFFKKPLPPPVPTYKPPVSVYKPPTPVYKPPVPIKKPCPPIVKPMPPPVPVRPLLPPVPIVKPLPPPVPTYKPPRLQKAMSSYIQEAIASTSQVPTTLPQAIASSPQVPSYLQEAIPSFSQVASNVREASSPLGPYNVFLTM